MSTGERAFARRALYVALAAIACALLAFGAMMVNEATTTSWGVLSPEHVREQALMVSVPMVGWQAFGFFAVVTRLWRGGRRAFAGRTWFTMASAPFDVLAVFVLGFVKGWAPPSQGEAFSDHALIVYFVADFVASLCVVAGAVVGRHTSLSSA